MTIYREVNEAFAVVPLYCVRVLGIPLERMNVNGGAISIGENKSEIWCCYYVYRWWNGCCWSV